MIQSFRHKGLRKLFADDNRSKLSAQDVDKIARILARLSAANVPEDVDAPGFKLHRLKGDLKGFWAVTVQQTGGSFSASRTETPWTWI